MAFNNAFIGTHLKTVNIEMADALLSDELFALSQAEPQDQHVLAEDVYSGDVSQEYTYLIQIGTWLQYARDTYGEKENQ